MDDWRECRLGDIGTVVGGGTPSRERADYWDGSIPWLTPGEITGNREKYVSETQDGISTLGLAASGAKLLSAGSLLMTSRASIGSCALAGKPMATNQGFTNLTPGTGIHPSFLFHLGLTLGREMTRRASGTTFLEISGGEFGRIAVRLPHWRSSGGSQRFSTRSTNPSKPPNASSPSSASPTRLCNNISCPRGLTAVWRRLRSVH